MNPYQNDTPKKAQVEQMFDTIAPKYDLLNRLLSVGIDTHWRRGVVRRAQMANHAAILDVACGTGDLSVALAKGTKASITGSDLSANMLRVAREKVNAKQLPITLVEADAEHMPFEDQAFDGVTCAFGVRNFGDLAQGLREMYRILKPHGKLYILEFSKPTNSLLAQLFKFYFHKILPTVGGWISGDKKAYQYLPQSVEEFPCGDQFLGLLTAAGFGQCALQRFTFGVATLYTAVK